VYIYVLWLSVVHAVMPEHWCSNARNAVHTFSARGSAVLPADPGFGILLSRLVVEPSMAQVGLKCSILLQHTAATITATAAVVCIRVLIVSPYRAANTKAYA
jgi:hypothetical protein